MAAKPRIALVGAGNLGSALAISLRRAGYSIEIGVARPSSLQRSQQLAREVRARVLMGPAFRVSAGVIWFCVPDSEIEPAAKSLVDKIDWKGKIALHSSGALGSDALFPLRDRGAKVASVHPMMTFVRQSRPSLIDVAFAIEGDRVAVRAARQIVQELGGQAFPIRNSDKAAYHAWGTFASPLLTALLATTERMAALAGVDTKSAKRRMMPILRQTLANYAAFDAKDAFSGPIIRGDLDTVRQHLRVLAKAPAARQVYLALGRAAAEYLPGKNKAAMRALLKSASR